MAAAETLSLLDFLLDEQQQLTAVERFAQRHASHSEQRFYRDLIPATPPGPGQQYAFRVDLDLCTGCKACVTACHNLNGLGAQETWRDVGLLIGGTPAAPALQTVTTTCHHCEDPACLAGCPVRAYEKDPVTGIVRHLDDQCIGCQYCTLKCPYDVPKYDAARGIVRKCDMCSDRLSAGEAPACVQGCPTSAISIDVVALEEASPSALLPVAAHAIPDSAYTRPTTRYVSARARGALRPANESAIAPADPHHPLSVMLVLTQLGVGAIAFEAARALLSGAGASPVGVAIGLRRDAARARRREPPPRPPAVRVPRAAGPAHVVDEPRDRRARRVRGRGERVRRVRVAAARAAGSRGAAAARGARAVARERRGARRRARGAGAR